MKLYEGILREQAEADIRNRRFLTVLFVILAGIVSIIHIALVWKKIFTFLDCTPIFIAELVLVFAADLCHYQMRQWISFRDKIKG